MTTEKTFTVTFVHDETPSREIPMPKVEWLIGRKGLTDSELREGLEAIATGKLPRAKAAEIATRILEKL